ncbi:MAG: RDD family protein [Candidatus Poribacteria bacterium]|nr:RDD family protein [Candidatus Poribacteria bacterium]
MSDHLSIETPEQIKISYSVAGIGSRFYAALIDIALLLPVLAVGYYVIIRAILDLDEGFGNWLAALAGIATFALQWGYYMIFEIATNGQSPGKRALGLRVIKVQGYPISFSDSAIRNIMRVVDMLPFAYGIGLLTMLLNKNWQRLGDLAAGTLVVKEGAEASPNPGKTPSVKKSTLVYVAWIKPERVTDPELGAIREYLSRRSSLPRLRRLQLARTIGTPVAQRMTDDDQIDYDVFLEEVYALKTNSDAD